jgi:hypothetical protein
MEFQYRKMSHSTTNHTYTNPVLTKIVGEPSSVLFEKLTIELYNNAMSVPSNRGGSAHGHLATIMASAEYDIMIGLGNQWEDPVNPGITPDILGKNAKQFQIANNNQTFAANIIECNIYLANS